MAELQSIILMGIVLMGFLGYKMAVRGDEKTKVAVPFTLVAMMVAIEMVLEFFK